MYKILTQKTLVGGNGVAWHKSKKIQGIFL